MHRRDRTRPLGEDAMTRKGLGSCTGANAVIHGTSLILGLGLGHACRCWSVSGFGRGAAVNEASF